MSKSYDTNIHPAMNKFSLKKYLCCGNIDPSVFIGCSQLVTPARRCMQVLAGLTHKSHGSGHRKICESPASHLRAHLRSLASPCESLVLSVILRLRNGLGVSYHLLSHYLRFYFRYFFKTKLVHCWVYIGIMRL